MPARLLPLAMMLSACGHKVPFHWAPPASSGTPKAACRPADPELARPLAEGLLLKPDLAAALFPDLGLQTSWVARVELRAHTVEECGIFVTLTDPELRLLTRRGDPLEVALLTEVMVHPRNILALQREATRPPPPTGAWLAPSRTALRHVGPVVVGSTERP